MKNDKRIDLLLVTDEIGISIDFDGDTITHYFQDKENEVYINDDTLYKEVLMVGKHINDLCNANLKESYVGANAMSGGKQLNFIKYEKEFINCLFYKQDKITNKKVKYVNEKAKNTIEKKLLHLSKTYGIGYYKNTHSLTGLLMEIHAIYELNNILDGIIQNRKISSKIWEFKDCGKELSNYEITKITKKVLNKYIIIRPLIEYSDGYPITKIFTIIEICFLYIIRKASILNEKKKSNDRLKTCEICANFYIPSGHNQKHCNKCKKEGQNLRKIREREKRKT